MAEKKEPKKLQVFGRFGVDVSGAEVGQIIKVAAVDDKGRPTKWEAAELPEIPEIPEQVQADWDQNNSDAKDYVKNRPFYYDPGTITKTYDGVNPVVDAGFCTLLIEEINSVRVVSGKYTYTYAGNNISYGSERKLYNMQSTASSNAKCYIEVSKSDGGVFDTLRLANGPEYSLRAIAGTVSVIREATTCKLDEKFIPDSIARTADIPGTINEAMKPLLLAVDSADTYLTDSSYGDAALAAIKAGRQILVRVPNADGGDYTAIYSPIMMYQVPNRENKYLYLFFLRDEKQDLSALLGQPAGTVHMPTYGQLKMLLSQEYNSNPLET